MFLVWGSAVLDDRMKFVRVGDKLKITFKGKGKNKKGQALNLYQVEVAQPQEALSFKTAAEEKVPDAGPEGRPDALEAVTEEAVI